MVNFNDWKTSIKTTYFWHAWIHPENNLKISAFIMKNYLEKDLRSVTANVLMYSTPIKKERVKGNASLNFIFAISCKMTKIYFLLVFTSTGYFSADSKKNF